MNSFVNPGEDDRDKPTEEPPYHSEWVIRSWGCYWRPRPMDHTDVAGMLDELCAKWQCGKSEAVARMIREVSR